MRSYETMTNKMDGFTTRDTIKWSTVSSALSRKIHYPISRNIYIPHGIPMRCETYYSSRAWVHNLDWGAAIFLGLCHFRVDFSRIRSPA